MGWGGGGLAEVGRGKMAREATEESPGCTRRRPSKARERAGRVRGKGQGGLFRGMVFLTEHSQRESFLKEPRASVRHFQKRAQFYRRGYVCTPWRPAAQPEKKLSPVASDLKNNH